MEKYIFDAIDEFYEITHKRGGRLFIKKKCSLLPPIEIPNGTDEVILRFGLETFTREEAEEAVRNGDAVKVHIAELYQFIKKES